MNSKKTISCSNENLNKFLFNLKITLSTLVLLSTAMENQIVEKKYLDKSKLTSGLVGVFLICFTEPTIPEGKEVARIVRNIIFDIVKLMFIRITNKIDFETKALLALLLVINLVESCSKRDPKVLDVTKNK